MLSMLSLPLLAQQTTTPTSEAPATATKGDRMQRYQASDPATRARRQTDRMTQALNLDQATSKKVYDVTLARAEKVEAIMKGSDPSNSKGKALREATDEYKSKLQGILTPEQMAKAEQLQEQTKGRMRGRQGTNPNDDKDTN